MQNHNVGHNLHDKVAVSIANDRKETDKKRLPLKTTKSQHSYLSVNAALMDEPNNMVSELTTV